MFNLASQIIKCNKAKYFQAQNIPKKIQYPKMQRKANQKNKDWMEAGSDSARLVS